VNTWITERKCFTIVFMCSIQTPNHFSFDWVEDHGTQNNMCFCYLNHHCVTTVKIGYKLVSGLCEHMNYWKRVFSNCLHVLNPNIKSFLLLVEWKIIKHKTIWVFVMWTIILSFIVSFWQFVLKMIFCW